MTFPLFSDRILNSIKTAIACLLGLLVAKLPIFPMGQWILITIIVVMAGQTSLGGALQKAYMRIIGTVSGALIAAVAVFFFVHHPFILHTILILSCLAFAYVAAGSGNIAGGGTLGAATVIMILMNPSPTLEVVIWRPLEIIVGILIALFVSRYLFPIRATLRLRSNLGESLNHLKELYVGTTYKVSESHKAFISHTLEEELLNTFILQRKLLAEAKAEHFGAVKKSTLYEIMQLERRFYRSVLLLNYTLHGNEKDAALVQALPEYDVFNHAVMAQLDLLIRVLRDKNSQLVLTPLSSEGLVAAIDKVLIGQPPEITLYGHAFSVGLKLLIEELNELSLIVRRLVV